MDLDSFQQTLTAYCINSIRPILGRTLQLSAILEDILWDIEKLGCTLKFWCSPSYKCDSEVLENRRFIFLLYEIVNDGELLSYLMEITHFKQSDFSINKVGTLFISISYKDNQTSRMITFSFDTPEVERPQGSFRMETPDIEKSKSCHRMEVNHRCFQGTCYWKRKLSRTSETRVESTTQNNGAHYSSSTPLSTVSEFEHFPFMPKHASYWMGWRTVPTREPIGTQTIGR